MATSRSKPNSPLQSTRQMLDELDALMDRMLALPVGDVENLPPLPRDVPALPATQTPSKGGAVRSQEPEDEFEKEEAETPLAARIAPRVVRTDLPRLNNGAVQAGPHLPPHKWHEEDIQEAVNKLEEAKKKPPLETAPQEPALDRKSITATAAPAALPIVQPAAPALTATAASPAAPMLPLLPLIWVNNAFDLCSLFLGPLGQGLRGARGRGFLGVVGLLCLVLAGAWFIFDQISAR